MSEKKYAYSQRALEILEEQGYIFLLMAEDQKKIKTWEIAEIINNFLPEGAVHIIEATKVKKYGNIILID